MRLGVYTDYEYHSRGGEISAERAFVLYLGRLAGEVASLTVIGRLDPDPARARYALAPGVGFVPLPYYPSLTNPVALVRATAGALARFWRALDDLDAVWLLGPHPFAIGFALLALTRRRRVILGVRQDLPAYVRARHPGRRGIRLVASVMEGLYRLLARRLPVVVVGPELARHYRRARSLLEIAVSLIDEQDLVAPSVAEDRSYDGELRIMTVGRLEEEKNPLLLAEVLAGLADDGGDWRLVVCGEGPLQEDLSRRLAELGLSGRADLRGYVPLDGGLMEIYRDCHMFLHVSWTEGLPQVLFEAFAAALPVVATDVGGIREAVGSAAILVPPGDPGAAVAGLRQLARDRGRRAALVEEGHRRARARTATAEVRRLADFLDPKPRLGGTPHTD